MDPVLATLLIGIGTILVNVLVWATGHRANRATERDAMVQRYAAAAKWSDEWAEKLERKVDAAREDVETLRGELDQVKGHLLRLAAFVRHVLDEWVRVNPTTPTPRIWNDIAHLIDPKYDEPKENP